MAGSLSPLDRAPPSLRNRRSNLLANAKAGVAGGFAVLTYKGRTWRIKHRGTEQVIRDGNNAPIPLLPVVIVGIAEGISKQYYERAYSDGDDAAPDCFSVDGVKPDPAATRKQNDLCASCRHNQWGSRVTDAGKRAKSCQDMRRLAVVPLGDIENQGYGGPMMLRIPPMSLNNLANYADFLARKGASFETVATRIGFDVAVAYPRITFEAIDYLTDEQLDQVIGPDGNSGVCADPLIPRMLGAVAVEEAPAPSPAPAPKRGPGLAAAPPPEPAPEEEEDEEHPEEEGEPEEEAPPAAAKPSPFTVATAAPKPAPVPAKPAAKPRRAAAATNGKVEPAPTNMESAIHNLLDA